MQLLWQIDFKRPGEKKAACCWAGPRQRRGALPRPVGGTRVGAPEPERVTATPGSQSCLISPGCRSSSRLSKHRYGGKEGNPSRVATPALPLRGEQQLAALTSPCSPLPRLPCVKCGHVTELSTQPSPSPLTHGLNGDNLRNIFFS